MWLKKRMLELLTGILLRILDSALGKYRIYIRQQQQQADSGEKKVQVGRECSQEETKSELGKLCGRILIRVAGTYGGPWAYKPALILSIGSY
jgi:hypothetical protein